jgi:hypothetical protein
MNLDRSIYGISSISQMVAEVTMGGATLLALAFCIGWPGASARSGRSW